jgi:hypothetical protein
MLAYCGGVPCENLRLGRRRNRFLLLRRTLYVNNAFGVLLRRSGTPDIEIEAIGPSPPKKIRQSKRDISTSGAGRDNSVPAGHPTDEEAGSVDKRLLVSLQ